MSGDVTYQALERLTHMPNRSGNQGDRLAGQLYYDVEIAGGSIANVTLTNVTGDIIGNASTATALQTPRLIGGVSFDGTADIVPQSIQVTDTTDSSCSIALFESATGDLLPKTDGALTYNASTGELSATSFNGSFTGNAATATKLQTPRTIGGVSFDGTANIVPQTIESANEASDTTCFPLFITASGTQQLQPKNNANLTFNSSTGALAATSFSGDLSGNASSATKLQTARAIYGNNFDGTAALTQVIASTYGGTGNGFTKFSGPTTTEKTFTLPNVSAAILTDNTAVTAAQGGTGLSTLTANNVILGNGTGNVLFVAPGTSGNVLTSNGTTWTSSAMSGMVQIGTSTPTGVAVVDFNNIPQTYSSLLLTWSGISNATTTRAFRISVDDAATYSSPLTVAYTEIKATTISSSSSDSVLWSDVTQTNAEVSSGFIFISGYQSGGPTSYDGYVSAASGATLSRIWGSIAFTTSPAFAATQSIRAYWNNTGNFDAGTITLYGIS